jgi:hypothetical protein
LHVQEPATLIELGAPGVENPLAFVREHLIDAAIAVEVVKV